MHPLRIVSLASTLLLVSCGGAKQPASADDGPPVAAAAGAASLTRAATAADEAAAKSTPTDASAGEYASAATGRSAFQRELALQGVGFAVSCANDAARNTLVVRPSGLAVDNAPQSTEVDGIVTGAEVGDLDADGSPEVYVFVRSGGTDARGSLVAYVANKRRSLSQATLPDLAERPDAAAGYRGGDEFSLLEGALGRRFPLQDANGMPTGRTRQIQYKLRPGEAGWRLVPDRVFEF